MKFRDLKDSVAVITGASNGIGQATAKMLVEEGVKVALVARSKDKLDALHAEDTANALVFAFAQPVHVTMQESLSMPTRQISP